MSFRSWLDVALPQLTEPLFGARAVSRLRELAAWLPGDCQTILEARLGTSSPAVDLSVQLADPSQALRVAEVPLPDHLRRFLRRWAQRHGAFTPVSRLWLEFDLRDDLPTFRVPSVCARLGERVEFEWLSESLWPAMQGRALTHPQLEAARQCWSEIPASAGLLYAFSLLSREEQPIRMELFGLEPLGSLLDYLRRVSPQHVAAAAPVAKLFESAERIHLSLDIASEVLPPIGIEGSFPRRPEREPRWGQLFDRLTESGLCLAAQRDAALAWPGTDTFWTEAERWPLAEAGIGACLVRGVSHVKVVCGPHLEPEAKVYLTLVPRDLGVGGAAASSAARASALSM